MKDSITALPTTTTTCTSCGSEIPESLPTDALCVECRYCKTTGPTPHAGPSEFEIAAAETPEPSPEEERSEEDVADAEMMNRVLAWFASPQALEYFGRPFGRKLIALAYVLGHHAADGKTLTQLAKDHGTSKQSLSRLTVEASRCFGIRNRAQLIHGGCPEK